MVLGGYGFINRQKAIFKKGYKRNQELRILKEWVTSKIIWKASSKDPKSGAIEVVAYMGAFACANFDAVSILNKELDDEKEKTLEIQSEKRIFIGNLIPTSWGAQSST